MTPEELLERFKKDWHDNPTPNQLIYRIRTKDKDWPIPGFFEASAKKLIQEAKDLPIEYKHAAYYLNDHGLYKK